jgi:hypothetical protein
LANELCSTQILGQLFQLVMSCALNLLRGADELVVECGDNGDKAALPDASLPTISRHFIIAANAAKSVNLLWKFFNQATWGLCEVKSLFDGKTARSRKSAHEPFDEP